ncbi:MAG: GNAT family N-acetyltransferase [Tissierellia bacterium]|nr:GNAT family N-acetyltransferase [Tissierellia bacterium]
MKIEKKNDGFVAKIDDKVIGEIDYVKEGDVLRANHTYVDPDHRGEGLAGKLFDSLIDFARKENYKIEPVCSYVVKRFEQSDEFDDLLSK